MALSYAEYKNMNMEALSIVRVMLTEVEHHGVQPTVEDLSAIEQMSYERAGLTERPADIVSSKGFLGFMMMVSTYPEEFAADIDFWVDCQIIAMQVVDMLSAGQDSDMVSVVQAQPDVVMAKRFILNPTSIIKG
ncbi:hypothetical protein VPHD148_0247 [Vibrio phage D148]